MRSFGTTSSKKVCLFAGLAIFWQCAARGQEPLAAYFEGKQVTVKIDMPATQKGIELYPDRPQPLDTKSYGDRLKQFGTSLRNGDTTLITKVKVKSDNIEFQLGGGGYGTATDMTDSAVHFTPGDKSSHEKELVEQLKSETDEDRRRSLSRELDDLKRDRERDDRRNRARAEDDADARRARIEANRPQGGSRFNIHFDKRKSGDALTPQVVMAALAQYVSFGPEGAAPKGGYPADGFRTDGPRSDPGGPPPPAAPQPEPAGNPTQSLKKGLTRAQVEGLFGPPTQTHEHTQDTLAVTSCTYQTATQIVQADFVNGVLVQYTVSSR